MGNFKNTLKLSTTVNLRYPSPPSFTRVQSCALLSSLSQPLSPHWVVSETNSEMCGKNSYLWGDILEDITIKREVRSGFWGLKKFFLIKV